MPDLGGILVSISEHVRFFVYKELEILGKKVGIHFQMMKNAVQSLLDEDKLEKDKVSMF